MALDAYAKKKGNVSRAAAAAEKKIRFIGALGAPVRPDLKDALLRAVIELPVTEAEAKAKAGAA